MTPHDDMILIRIDFDIRKEQVFVCAPSFFSAVFLFIVLSRLIILIFFFITTTYYYSTFDKNMFTTIDLQKKKMIVFVSAIV